MPVRIGENETVVTFADGFGLGDEFAAGFFNFGGPVVGFGFAFGGEGEYDLVNCVGVGKFAVHGRLEDIFFEEMDDEIIFAKKEADQVIGSAVKFKPELGVKLSCAVQVVYGKVAPYLFWFHDI